MDRTSLTTAEAVVLDGANGVTGAPRAHFPWAVWSVPLALALVVLSRLALTRGKRWWLPALLCVAALPGLWEVLLVRADAPMKRFDMAEVVRNTLAEMQRLAPWPDAGPGREDDDVLFPLARYAIPGRKAPSPAVILDTRGGKLGQGCQVDGTHVVCGAGP